MAIKSEKDGRLSQLEPPQAIDAEQQVLGAVLKDSDAINLVIEYLDLDDYFYVSRHKIIYRAILNLYEKSSPCDITTVADELTKMDQIEKIGGRVYLVELVDGVVSVANVVSYANIILEKAVLRRLITVSNDIVKSCYVQEEDVSTILDLAEQNIFSISESRLRKGFTALSQLLPKTFEQIEDFQETKGGLIGIQTGFKDLDAMTAGLHNGDFIVIGGRPSMGKTAFALNMAEFVAVEQKVPVGVFSIEMSKEQVALRFLCGRAKISQHLLRTDRLKDSEWKRLSYASGPLSEAPLFIDDSATLSILEMRAKARRLKAQHNIGLLIVDYIQMIYSSSRTENRQQEMAMISRSLKTLAKELNIPVVACSQLSRLLETRTGEKRPQLSDLRESGAIEQDADVVMFVFRPEFYLSHLDKDDQKRRDAEGRAEIILAKQRNGPTGSIHLAFLKDFVRFENMEYRQPGTETPF
ncbi:MAG: replicative DNA helicase [candidate division Zixibacteria bacterium]|nr:replicative DNA helicase [candidate division Zixibacteria bacterium]